MLTVLPMVSRLSPAAAITISPPRSGVAGKVWPGNSDDCVSVGISSPAGLVMTWSCPTPKLPTVTGI
jgi:hypothetical protein